MGHDVHQALSRFVASLQSSFGSLEMAAKALGTGAQGLNELRENGDLR